MATSIMPKLFMTVSIATLFFAINNILPASAEAKETFRTAFTNTQCTWKEVKNKEQPTKRWVKVECKCDTHGSPLDFHCYYESDVEECCKKSPKDSNDHYYKIQPPIMPSWWTNLRVS